MLVLLSLDVEKLERDVATGKRCLWLPPRLWRTLVPYVLHEREPKSLSSPPSSDSKPIIFATSKRPVRHLRQGSAGQSLMNVPEAHANRSTYHDPGIYKSNKGQLRRIVPVDPGMKYSTMAERLDGRQLRKCQKPNLNFGCSSCHLP